MNELTQASNHVESFTGSVPAFYEKYMVPMIFAPYAIDLASRIKVKPGSSILEVAAGTGVATRQLSNTLPNDVAIVATDLSQAMIDLAALIGTSRPVEWRQADAMQLPFDNMAFDLVLCQFGVMFFSDKTKAFGQIRRVLKPGGTLLFSTWDRIDENEFVNTVSRAVQRMFPSDPPKFMERVPHGYYDREVITRDLVEAGFSTNLSFETVPSSSHAKSAQIAAIAYCQGTPLRGEIEARDGARLAEATLAAERALADRFGTSALVGKIKAHIVSAVNSEQ